MTIITSLLLMIISSSFCVPHYRPSSPFYPHHPVWVPRLALAKYLVEGKYHLRQNPYDGHEKLLAAYNVSENAIKIIRESVDVVEISCDGDGEITFSRSPGVDVARVPRKVSVRSKPGEVVDYKHPVTGEDSNFSWRLVSPVSLVTTVEGKLSGLVEVVTWTFSSYGAQVTQIVGGIHLDILL